MVHSMTGYGRGQDVVDGLAVVVEIKSVNHRYYEYSSRLPRGYGFLDDKLKSYLQQRISRGKVDVFVQVHALETAGSEVVVDHALAQSYLEALRDLSQRYGVRDDVTAAALSRYPEVLTIQQAAIDEDKTWEAVRIVAEQALERFIAMRQQEGARMREDILSRGETIRQAVAAVEQRSPQTVREHMEKVETRMRELLQGVPVDEARLL
ncbi:MAG: hypothetical protein IIX61_06935, partial [Loktanella sp.]|nr:hypothetical protein [Loktanella sp.]